MSGRAKEVEQADNKELRRSWRSREWKKLEWRGSRAGQWQCFPRFESQPQDGFHWTIVDIMLMHNYPFRRCLSVAAGQCTVHMDTKSNSNRGGSFGRTTARLAGQPINHRSITGRVRDFSLLQCVQTALEPTYSPFSRVMAGSWSCIDLHMSN